MHTKLKWFKIDEPIPAGSTYIKSADRVVGVREVYEESWPPYGGCSSGGMVATDVMEEMYLYEILIKEADDENII